MSGELITLGFKPALASHKERMERPENLHMAEVALKELTGAAYRIRCIILEQPAGSPSAPGGHLVQAALNAGARRLSPDS